MTEKFATVAVDFLNGLALNYAVVKAQGIETSEDGLEMWVKNPDGSGECKKFVIPNYCESIQWGWSVLSSLKIEYRILGDRITASFVGDDRWLGDTYIEAGLRCFVASKFPNGIIEIPPGLVGV